MSGLPTNSGHAKDKGCSPVSSNCVVWQGPDIECIDLCKGDTVSDVVAKLGFELCALIEMFDLEGFDFTCLNVPVTQRPEDMGGLIQILIDRICALEGIDPETGEGAAGNDCPENCIVPIADCFHFINEVGDSVTTLPLLDYVTAIGNRICDIIDDVTVLQNEVQTLQDQINGDGSGGTVVNPGGIVAEVNFIKDNYASRTSLQYQLSTKTDPTGSTEYITQALRKVENSLIGTQDAVGTTTELYQNIIKQGNIGEQDQLYGNGTMRTITGWTTSPTKTAESLGNLWLAIDDIRKAVAYVQENCCSTGCSDIFLNFRATINVQPASTFLTIFTDGSTGFTRDWKETNGTTRVTVTDALGNSSTFKVSLLAIIDEPSGYQIDLTPTSIDPTQDITVVADTQFINTATDTTCETDYSYTIKVSPDIPATVLTVYSTSVAYQFNSTPGYSYIVNVYNAGSSTPAATQIIASPGAIVFNSIMGLTPDTDYELEVVIVDSSGTETAGPKQPFTTLPDNCIPPINAIATLTTP